MDVLFYLFDPFMLIFTHRFVVLGYTISMFEIFFFGSLISWTGYALAKLFKGD